MHELTNQALSRSSPPGSSVKEPPRPTLPQGDSGIEEGLEGGSPRPEHRSLGGLLRSTHRALLGGGSLLASVALGRHLDVPHIPPRVPPRTNPHHHSLQEVNITAPKVPSSDPPVVDDLITFSSLEHLPRPLFDFPCALHAPGVKPLPLTPPPPHPRERACHRHAQTSQSPRSPHYQVQGQASPAELAPSPHHTNGEAGCDAWGQGSDRRRRSSQGLLSASQLGECICTNTDTCTQHTSPFRLQTGDLYYFIITIQKHTSPPYALRVAYLIAALTVIMMMELKSKGNTFSVSSGLF